MVIKNKYEFGDTVFVKTDVHQFPRMITGICIRPMVAFTYELSSGGATTWHYEFELSESKDVLIKNENY